MDLDSDDLEDSYVVSDDFHKVSPSDPTTIQNLDQPEEAVPLILADSDTEMARNNMGGTVRTLNPYERFTPTKKKVILAIILWTSVLPGFVSGAFSAGFLDIGRDLHLDGVVLNYTVGSYTLVRAVGSLFWGVHATFYGRRFVFLMSLPLLCLGCLGVALCRTPQELFISRILQAMGAASITSTSVAIISDLYPPESRGTIIGIWTGNPIPVLAPFLSGMLHPLHNPPSRNESSRLSHFVLLNPFKSLGLLRTPVVLIWALFLTCAWVTGTSMWDALPVNYNVRYGIESPITVGLCYLPADISYVVSSGIAGYLSDKALTKPRRRRSVPEDRLHIAFLGSLILIPSSVLLSGFTLDRVQGDFGFALSLILLFINGFGIGLVHSPGYTYMIDIYRERSAETKAIGSAFEGGFASFFSVTVLPCINAFGVVWTFTGIAFVGLIGSLLLHLTIRYGAHLKDGL